MDDSNGVEYSFEYFLEKFKLKEGEQVTGEWAFKSHSNTHAQIAYMAYLHGCADGAKQAIDLLASNLDIEESAYLFVLDVIVDRNLSILSQQLLPKTKYESQ